MGAEGRTERSAAPMLMSVEPAQGRASCRLVARYQETKIRHFHALWDQYLAPNQVEGGPKSSGRAAG